MGFIDKPDQIVMQLYSEPLQRFRLAAQGHGPIQPPAQHRDRVAAHFDPLPVWHAPFEEDAVAEADFPMHAITQRPMAMRSEEHTSELQSLMRISYAVFCLKKKNQTPTIEPQ